MTDRYWTAGDGNTALYAERESGLIIGECGKIGVNSFKYYCTVFTSPSESGSLGVYISAEAAKAAIEKFWTITDRTLIE